MTKRNPAFMYFFYKIVMKTNKYPYTETFFNKIHKDVVIYVFMSFLTFTIMSSVAQHDAIKKRDLLKPELIQPLGEGDLIPKELWYNKFNALDSEGKSIEVKLDDYKNKKVIILDFWATWCGTCINSLPVMDTLSYQFRNEIQVILISHQSREKIANFLERKQQDYSFPFVFEENTLERYFPHRYLPHTVLLSNNKVFKVLGSEKLNVDKINELLK